MYTVIRKTGRMYLNKITIKENASVIVTSEKNYANQRATFG